MSIDDSKECRMPTTKRGNPDWPHTNLAEPNPCLWRQGHEGPCNADPWADLIETELAEGTD